MLDAGGRGHDPDSYNVDLKWLSRSLSVGQQVTLTVVDVEQGDPAATRRREDPSFVEQRRRRYYERLKRDYGDG